MSLVVAIDAGTTGVRSLAVAESGAVVASRYREFPQYFPRPGWVEHDPAEIWDAVVATLSELLAGLDQPVSALGITNQRETVVVWDRRSSRPPYRALVWQDRRTAEWCESLEAAGHLAMVRSKTGLVLDPYFSASKLAWLFGPGGLVPDADTAVGTVDSWLIWKLTAGQRHITDVTNASRTLLFDITRLRWDDELTDLFGVPESVLPEVGPTSGRLGVTAAGAVPGLAAGVPISGVAGDQQAALFGQACFTPGMIKNTYGTGSFVLMNVGAEPPDPVAGLLSTPAWALDGTSPADTTYALEGSIFITGAAIQWLRDGLGMIADAAEIGPLAASVSDSGGAVFVPALTGLGSPWWDARARGTIVGLTRGVGRAHLARAVVDAMAFQTKDVIDAMAAASGHSPTELRVDGGASVMDLLMTVQADLLGIPVVRATLTETTAVGAAFLAGRAEGVWGSLDEIRAAWSASGRAEPAEDRSVAYQAWRRAVERSMNWETSPA